MQPLRPVRWAIKRLRGISIARRRYMMVGTVMSGLNVGLLVLLVDLLIIPAAIANVSRTVVTTQIHFCIHRWYTWRGLDERAAWPFWQQWRRFHVLRAGSIAVQQSAFFLLVSIGVHHLIAYFSLIIAIGLVNLKYAEKFVWPGEHQVCREVRLQRQGQRRSWPAGLTSVPTHLSHALCPEPGQRDTRAPSRARFSFSDCVGGSRSRSLMR